MRTKKGSLVCFILLTITIASCKKNVNTTNVADGEIATAKPTPPPPPTPVHGVCDYDINDAAIGAGWTKTFEDLFSTNSDSWNTWYGGAFNNELQLYQASNVSVTNGNLVIAA